MFTANGSSPQSARPAPANYPFTKANGTTNATPAHLPSTATTTTTASPPRRATALSNEPTALSNGPATAAHLGDEYGHQYGGECRDDRARCQWRGGCGARGGWWRSDGE